MVWSTLQGNMVSEGLARFSSRADGGTTIVYTHKIVLDLPLGRLVAKLLQPVVRRVVEPSIRDFVGQMLASIPA